MPVTANVILTEFNSRYEAKYGRKTYFNSWNITLAARIGKFYTPGEIKKALDFYFEIYGQHSIQDFLDHISDIMEERDTTIASNERTEELVQETKRRMKSIYESRSSVNN